MLHGKEGSFPVCGVPTTQISPSACSLSYWECSVLMAHSCPSTEVAFSQREMSFLRLCPQQPTFNTGSLWSYQTCPWPQFQILKGHPLSRVSCRISRSFCYICTMHHRAASPSAQSAEVAFMGSLANKPSTRKSLLKSVFLGNQTCDGTKNGFREAYSIM